MSSSSTFPHMSLSAVKWIKPQAKVWFTIHEPCYFQSEENCGKNRTVKTEGSRLPIVQGFKPSQLIFCVKNTNNGCHVFLTRSITATEQKDWLRQSARDHGWTHHFQPETCKMDLLGHWKSWIQQINTHNRSWKSRIWQKHNTVYHWSCNVFTQHISFNFINTFLLRL